MKTRGSGQIQRYLSLLAVIILCLCPLTACGSDSGSDTNQASEIAEYDKNPAVNEEKDSSKPGSRAEASTKVYDRKIIKNAEISISVVDTKKILELLEQKINDVGGYISESSYHNTENNRRRCSITVRVPAEKFTETINWLQNAGKVNNKRVYTEDVTDQYIDLEARIKNLEAQEYRLQDILGKANTVEEILQVEKELERVRGDLESLTGKFKYLQNRLSFSTINISLEENVTASQNISTSSLGNIFQRCQNAFTGNTNSLLSGISNLIVFFVGGIPLLLPLGIMGAAIWWMRKRYRVNKDKNNQ